MDREAYSRWIRQIRGKVSQEEFGSKICHFKNIDQTKVCSAYHRNEVSNWEQGRNLPSNLETFISIALLDFDGQQPEQGRGDDYRNRRLCYVQDKMELFLGQKLYCRSVHDALLMQVCRDVITFEELLVLEPQLEQIVQRTVINKEQKSGFALERKTVVIAGDMFQVRTQEDIKNIVWSYKEYFYTGVRTFGERLIRCFHKRSRYAAEISFAQAVRIYAPNYRDSWMRIFKSSGITRQWIIDLCIHLRFNRNEIQEVLENAHLIPLLSDPGDEESCYEEQGQLAIGSAGWYQYLEIHAAKVFPAHFGSLRFLPLKEKFLIAVLMLMFIKEADSVSDLVPVDYLLESFTRYSCGKEALKIAAQLIQSFDGRDAVWDAEAMERLLRQKTDPWVCFLENVYDVLDDAAAFKVYENYCGECSQYYGAATGVEVVKLRYFAALLYTVFTGRYYMGSLADGDLMEIEEMLRGQMDGWKSVYNFINQYLITFLSGLPLYEDKAVKGCYCFVKQHRLHTFNMEQVTEDIWESLQMLGCTK